MKEWLRNAIQILLPASRAPLKSMPYPRSGIRFMFLLAPAEAATSNLKTFSPGRLRLRQPWAKHAGVRNNLFFQRFVVADDDHAIAEVFASLIGDAATRTARLPRLKSCWNDDNY